MTTHAAMNSQELLNTWTAMFANVQQCQRQLADKDFTGIVPLKVSAESGNSHV
jgi:hypothetical protein